MRCQTLLPAENERKQSMIYLQISTAQGPAECQMFAAFALRQILREAEQAGVQAELLEETPSKYGILSAVLKFNGKNAEALAGRWLGTLQWVCPSPLRPQHPRKNWYIGVFRLPEIPELPNDGDIEFQTCRAGGKGGQHVNKTESAVRAVHLASGIAVRVESERSQHANKKRALELLALKLAEHHQSALQQHAAGAHKSLYQVERGNQQRVFMGQQFKERLG
ncbi:peptide chain release factor H [Eikenella sp. Marseille-P7795]|uniref:peptide chain release factor H n=1 Tax=Eikenella sp. Marseille-P7795 TaxID=2866577 RepID=UPI001CE4B52D